MKTIGTILLAVGIVLSPDLLHAQAALVGSVNNDLAPVQPAVPDSVVQITAEMQGLQPVAYSDLPLFGTYWEVMPGGGMAPLPAPMFDPSLPIYDITGNIFLVDASDGQLPVNPRQTSMMSAAVQTEATAVANLIAQVQAASATSLAASPMTMTAMDSGLSGPPGFGDTSTNSYSPHGITNGISAPNYGTNLWIAETAVASGYLNGIASNTVEDVGYTIQSVTNLALAQNAWQNEGVIFGSEYQNEEFPFTAPDTGYQTAVGFDFKKDQPDWAEGISKDYYIRFGNPPVYGRLHVETQIDLNSVRLTYAINPDGTQNLEPQSP